MLKVGGSTVVFHNGQHVRKRWSPPLVDIRKHETTTTTTTNYSLLLATS